MKILDILNTHLTPVFEERFKSLDLTFSDNIYINAGFVRLQFDISDYNIDINKLRPLLQNTAITIYYKSHCDNAQYEYYFDTTLDELAVDFIGELRFGCCIYTPNEQFKPLKSISVDSSLDLVFNVTTNTFQVV